MKPVIKINFSDFWHHFDKNDNYFIRLLSKEYVIELSDNPDFLIYSCYGNEHLEYSCLRIFYNGENLRVNWNACDFAFSFDYINDERHFRLPNWIWYTDLSLLLIPKIDPEGILKDKTGFCNMVVSNPLSFKRIDFFHKLSKYKTVDSGGRHLNNIGGPVQDKFSFIKKYKFTISFENSSYPGYTTEKLIEPMLANSLPIYWGNTMVGKDFNTDSFINYHDFKSDNEVIDRIIELDKRDDLYIKMMAEPWFKMNQLPECVDNEKVLGQFEKIFNAKGKITPVAQTIRQHFYHFNIQFQRFDSFFNRHLKYKKNFR